MSSSVFNLECDSRAEHSYFLQKNLVFLGLIMSTITLVLKAQGTTGSSTELKLNKHKLIKIVSMCVREASEIANESEKNEKCNLKKRKEKNTCSLEAGSEITGN